MTAKRRISVLVVDDDEVARQAVETVLRDEGYQVEAAGDGPSALACVDAHVPDVVVTDFWMPGMDGVQLLESLQQRHEGLPVVLLTASSEVTSAVRAMRAGAFDYLVKPIDFEELLLALERAVEHRDVRAEAELLRRQLREQLQGGFAGMLGDSPAMMRLTKVANQVAQARATVLITGESGTGKGELARAIHARSPRADKPFVALHCASLAETLLESELFGHERGSFTGADKRRIGRFEQAHGGTLFLDEIGEIPASIQLKLLRVLQERTFERVGGNESIRVDVRLIAATNRDLATEVAERRFREDLYYRLNVVHIESPPLRARDHDVILLANHFLAHFATENEKSIRGFTNPAIAKLLAHAWPGNVRELENVIERAVVLAEGAQIDASDLPIYPESGGSGPRLPGATLAEIERHAILTTLQSVQGSTSRAAQMLGISVRMIQYRLREYGVSQPRGRRPSRATQEIRTAGRMDGRGAT